jgi:predicted DNA-binding protein (UPF0251 family)
MHDQGMQGIAWNHDLEKWILPALADQRQVDRHNLQIRLAELVNLRFFVGFTLNEAAKVLGIAGKTAEADFSTVLVGTMGRYVAKSSRC